MRGCSVNKIEKRARTRGKGVDDNDSDRLTEYQWKASMSAQYFTIKSDNHGPADTRFYAIFIERVMQLIAFFPGGPASTFDLAFVERRFAPANIHAMPRDAETIFY